MANTHPIPLCRSEWLQDVSIELGRRFASRPPFDWFAVNTDTGEHEGEQFERLSVWATTPYGTLVNLTLWDDRTLWIGVRRVATEHAPEFEVGFYPTTDGLGSDRIAEAFRDSVAVSTRLCYSESPEPTLRRLWNHTAEVLTRGSLGRRREAPQTAPGNGDPSARSGSAGGGGGPPSVK
ncbi:MAG: hypothetical protein J0L84_13070 [Verrucomicrobia bacterium]|nr:hypothetical protein [Verrucomicrobiota bacterium]